MYSCLLRTEIILCWVVGLFDLFACMHICWEPLRLLCLTCHVYLLRTEIIFVRIEIIVLIFTELLTIFLIVKLDGYPITTRNLTGMGMCTDFYTWIWVCVWVSTHDLFVGRRVIALPDPLPSLDALASDDVKWRYDWVMVIVGKLRWSFYSSEGWESSGPGRVAYCGGANSMLWFQLNRGGDGMKCCWNMKQRQRVRLGSIRRKHDTVRRRGDIG
jgi:hypothetical protein